MGSSNAVFRPGYDLRGSRSPGGVILRRRGATNGRGADRRRVRGRAAVAPGGKNDGREDLAAGRRWLESCEWERARETFEQAVERRPCPEAWQGLGEALFWLGDLPNAMRLHERAYLGFRDRGDRAAASRIALWLATQHMLGYGNAAVANGWLGRAERLLGQLGTCAELGWLLLRRARSAASPAEGERLARRALEVARAVDDRDLEIAAISQRGRALVAAGEVDAGFRCLDEAMAAATSGEVRGVDTVGDTCCDMIGACERAMEIERASEWCRVTTEYARRIKFLPLFAACRLTYASILISVGRWPEAEAELLEAVRSYRASFASQAVRAVAKLAELRVLQGREAEAEELLAGHAHDAACGRAFALLHLARGEPAEAVRLLDKRLATAGGDLLAAAPLLSLLVEAHLAAGDVAAAADKAGRLQKIAAATKREAFAGWAMLASAQVACARQDPAAADRFEAATEVFVRVGLPLPAARARLGLALCLLKDNARAAKEAGRLALAALESLGARRDVDAAGELRRKLGIGTKVGARRALGLTRREEEVLALLSTGLSNPAIARRLFISRKTVEHHVGNILGKLGLDSRAAAAAYAVKRGTPKPAVR
jgi:DNA-binding CsgD family transcriptional regulator